MLSSQEEVVVLLPPGNSHLYDRLREEGDFSLICFLPSPGRRFFSTPHLKWLRGHLRSSDNNLVLISRSLDRDLTGALVVLAALLLSGKPITHLSKGPATEGDNQEAGGDSTQGLRGKWTSKEFNQKILAQELLRRMTLAPPGHLWEAWEILYLLMFVSLVAKKFLADRLVAWLKIGPDNNSEINTQ